MSSGVSRMVVGSVTGTGSAMDITTVGFKPRKVELFNITGLVTGVWVEGMADASVAKRVTAGDMTVPTTGGVTPLSNGFTLGNDSDLNVAAELVRYVAHE